MSCSSITAISNTEYIGNSLSTINNNFITLKNDICDNQSQILLLQSSLQALDTILTNLSSQSSNGVITHWVKFSGLMDSSFTLSFANPDRHLFNSSGISSVYRKSIGDYRIFFSQTQTSTNYNFSVSNKETLFSSKYYWAQVYHIEKNYVDVKVRASDGSFADSEFISLIIFI